MAKPRRNTRQIILDSALMEFSKVGYENTSIKLIAKRGKISSGLIYNYFSSKDDLLKNIFKGGIQDFKKYYEDGIEAHDLPTLILKIFDSFDKFKNLWRLYHLIKLQQKLYVIVLKEINELEAYLIEKIAKLLRMENNKDADMEAVLLFSCIDGISIQYLSNDNYKIEKIIKHLINKFK